MRFKLDLILPTGQNWHQHPNRSTNEMLDLMLLETTAPQISRLKTLTSLSERGTNTNLIFFPHYWCGSDEERMRDILLSETKTKHWLVI